jgi:ABC-type transport system substrate-binding protein
MRFPNSSSRDVFVFGALLLSLTAAACRDRAPKPAGTEGGILREALFSDPASFDPRAQVDAGTYGIMYAMYNTLAELDDSLRVTPALARGWETADQRTWRFHLRSDAFFHPDSCFGAAGRSRAMKSRDVVFSLNRALAPGAVGSFMLTDIVQGASDVSEGKAKTASGIRTLNDSTVEIVLLKPYGKLPVRLAAPFFFVVPQDVVTCRGEQFARRPVGTGPFMLQRLVAGRGVTLTRNPRYWKKDGDGKSLPYLSGVEYRVMGDPQVALTEFRGGRLDAVEVPPVLSSMVLNRGRPAGAYQRYTVKEVVAVDVHFLAFRMDQVPFREEPKLRQALNYAVDKEQIANVLLNGLATPARGVLPPAVYPEAGQAAAYPYDPERAKRLLAEAGFPGGRGLPELVLNIDDQVTTETVAQFVQSNLAAVGVRIRINKADFNTLLAEVSKGSHPFYYMFWEGTDPNPEIFMVQFKSDLLPEKGGYNFGRYRNPRVDSLYEAAVVTLDERQSRSIWLQLERTLVEDAPWLFLYHTRRVRLLQPGVSGYPHNPLQIRRFETTRIR